MPIEQLFGEDSFDTKLLTEMAIEAQKFLESQPWCKQVFEGYFAAGLGGIFAIFLFRIDTAAREADEWMWIINGDIPPAYLPLSDEVTPREVFEAYLAGMLRWVAVARGERLNGPDVPPVAVSPTREWADNLKNRLTVLEEMLPPFLESNVQ